MQKLLVLSVILALSAATLTGTTSCTCKNFAYQTNCTNAGYCIWNTTNSTCAAPTTKTATNAVQCYAANGVWNATAAAGSQCTAFSSCTAIALTTVADCQAAYPTCTFVAGATACSLTPVTPAPACSTYTTAATCNAATSGNSFCFFTAATNVCAPVTACSQLATAACTAPYCQVIAATATAPASCAPATCAGLGATAASCTYVSNTVSTATLPITLCALNTATPVACVNAPNTSTLNTPTLCSTNTLGTYTWSSNDAASGSCNSCYGAFVQAMFAILAFALLLA